MGNRSSGAGHSGVARTYVRLPGFSVSAQLCLPSSHPHALWLLCWLERLLEGASLRDLLAAPPWPCPADPAVARRLLRELIDLRWAVPDLSTVGCVVAPQLIKSYRAEGRAGLVRQLFAAEVVPAEWWMDGVGGTLLSRQTALQFDWDFKKKWDVDLPVHPNPQSLLERSPPDLADLLRKLGGSQRIWQQKDRAYLATPLLVGGRKDLLFPLYGEDCPIVDDELSELAPVLARSAPRLFDKRSVAPVPARVQDAPISIGPLEHLAAEVARLPTDLVSLGPLDPVRTRLERLAERVQSEEEELCARYKEGRQLQPIAGPSESQFAALTRMCAALHAEPAGQEPWVLLTSAFLNPDSLRAEQGLIPALAAAPISTRFLLVYGHANSDLPAQQRRDMDAYLRGLRALHRSVAERCLLVAGRRRSHEKVILTSRGHWLLGSFNPASSRPGSALFECSLRGQDAAFSLDLLAKLKENLEPEADHAVAVLDASLRRLQSPYDAEPARSAVARLVESVARLIAALPGEDTGGGAAWPGAVRGLRAALLPFLIRAQVELVDGRHTRDRVVSLCRTAVRDVLFASDRLADSALDGATLRELGGDARKKRTIRVAWGREAADLRPADPASRDQIARAQQVIKDARERLGPSFCTSSRPMGNHAKVLLIDGVRGLVTSENLLAYGAEKDASESRELGILFCSPSVAQHLLGCFILRWPGPFRSEYPNKADPPYEWIAAGLQTCHSLAPAGANGSLAAVETSTLGAALQGMLAKSDTLKEVYGALERQLGLDPVPWLREEGERLGLLLAADGSAWVPYDSPPLDAASEPAGSSTTAAQQSPPSRSAPAVKGSRAAIHPLVARVRSELVRIPAGRFFMGDTRVREESPRHQVVISRDFWLARTPVTQRLWKEVMGGLPFLRDSETDLEYPIIQVDYADIQRFFRRLNALPGGGSFDLPTEAQWEYACRAGTTTAYSFGDDPGLGNGPGLLEKYAWTKRSGQAHLQRVAQLLPNAWGLFDMHGLVYETMKDAPRRYTAAEVTDPIGPLDEGRIVARGGFWGRFPVDSRAGAVNEHFRCASRQRHEKSFRVSFRILCRLEE
jgi:formylglycine-generating enzyme required for sulfatase activity